jgi:hypothetical protein
VHLYHFVVFVQGGTTESPFFGIAEVDTVDGKYSMLALRWDSTQAVDNNTREQRNNLERMEAENTACTLLVHYDEQAFFLEANVLESLQHPPFAPP